MSWQSVGHRFAAAAVFFALLTLSFGPLVAQPPADNEKKVVEGDSKTGDPPKTDDKPAKPWRDISIYIPYDKLHKLFEKEGRGVYVTYEKFQELLKAAQAAGAAKQAEGKLPVESLITSIENEANVGRDVVLVKSKLSIELLSPGWTRLPLRLGDSAIRSARIAGEPARILRDEQGHTLLIEKQGKEPQSIVLELEFSKAFTKSPGNNRVTFQSPQAAVNHWKVRLAEPGVRVAIHPQAISGDDAKPDPAAKETVVEADVGSAAEVAIDWTPKSEGAAGLAALASVQTRADLVIDEGIVRAQVHLMYTISRSQLDRLTLEAAAGYKVVNVFDPNVQKWEITQSDETKQTIVVQLFEPAKGSQALRVELERVDESLTTNGVAAPSVKALEAQRQFGVLAVRITPALRADVAARTGLSQLDAGELPPELANQPWAYSYRFAAVPYSLTLNVHAVEPRIEATEFVEAYIEPQQTTVELLASLNIERAGIFSIDATVPEGYEVRNVAGRAFADVQPAVIESHHWDAQKNRLTIQFGRKALGKTGLVVQLVKRMDDPRLLTPSGETVDFQLDLPRIAHPALERSQGYLIVYAPDALRFKSTTTTGLQNIAVSEVLSKGLSVRDGRMPHLRETSAFAFFQDAAKLQLAIERRTPQVTVRQSLAATIESGIVRYDAVFHYDIRYSGVRSLRIDVPTDLVNAIRNKTKVVADAPYAKQPDDTAANYTAIEFKGEGELIGAVEIPLTWETRLEEFTVGKPMSIRIPRLIPMKDSATNIAIDRAWGQIALAKAEMIDLAVEGDSTGLRPIDPQTDLVDKGTVANPARAFEFHSDWTLGIAVTRYELDDVKRTSIDRAIARVIATRQGQLSVQAIYRLRSAHQRLKIKLPPGIDPATAFDSQPLHINGTAVPLERDAQAGVYFAPLTNTNPEQLVLVELRYSMPGTASEIVLPEFPDNPAVQKVYLSAYLPKERKLVAIRGPWTDEEPWHPPPLFAALGVADSPRHATSDDAIVQWVIEGTSLRSQPNDRFLRDGEPHLFSTLSPASGAAGALRISTWNETTLNVLVYAVLLAMGCAVLWRPIAERIAFLAMIFAAVFLAAVFQPTLAATLLNGPVISATAMVLLIWFVRWLIWLAQELYKAHAASLASTTQPAVDGVPMNNARFEFRPSSQPPVEDNRHEAEPSQGGAQ
jgi:hypothetical protein